MYVFVYFISLLVDNVDSVMSSSFFISPSLSSSSYDNPVSMATSGPPVLILSLISSAAVIIIIMAMILTLMLVGLYATKRRKRNFKSNVFLITIIIIIINFYKDKRDSANPAISGRAIHYHATLNEAYDSITAVTTGGDTIHANVVYESIEGIEPEGIPHEKGLHANIAYDSITGLRSDVIYDTITPTATMHA